MIRRIEARLADWHRLYKELGGMQMRLSMLEESQRPERAGLEAEVARLKQQSDAALHAIQAALRQDNPRERQATPAQRHGEADHARDRPGAD